MTGYVALGSNLGDRLAHLEDGLAALPSRGLDVDAVSSVWETEPVETLETQWFLNAAARIRTALSPRDVLDRLQDAERALGRRRAAPNAPRTLDLDLLTLGDLRHVGPGLVLPHPRMWSRRFVLAPLAELDPGLRDPETGRSVRESLEALPAAPRVRRVALLAMPRALPVQSGSL